MSIFAKIFGSEVKTPSALKTIAEVGAAIAACDAERSTIDRERARLIERRQAAFECDKSDAEIKKIDAELDRVEIAEERLEILLNRLHGRMTELQSADRRQTLDFLRAEYSHIEISLDSALAAVIEPLERWHDIVRQIDASGFEVDSRSFIVHPPLIGSGAIASTETLELWRQERERLADMLARVAKGLMLHTPRSEPNVVAIPSKPIFTPTTVRRPARLPNKSEVSPSYGYSKVIILRNGIEINSLSLIAGDEIVLPNHQAEQIVRNAAGEILETGKPENEAAE